jgi:co-chaperonin GroES (HSP10)
MWLGGREPKYGIVVPETAKFRAKWGTVIDVGKYVQEDIQLGDRVAITWSDGTPWEDPETRTIYELFHETEILCIDMRCRVNVSKVEVVPEAREGLDADVGYKLNYRQ